MKLTETFMLTFVINCVMVNNNINERTSAVNRYQSNNNTVMDTSKFALPTWDHRLSPLLLGLS